MDQAKVQEVDVHKGLENTLLILKYKLKKEEHHASLVTMLNRCR